MTEKLIITINNGTSEITVGDGSCMFGLLAHSGFAAADYSVAMSSGGSSDGGYITSARLDSRTLGINFDFGGRLGENTRQSLIRFFAPNRELTITAQRGAIQRTITGHAIDFDISETNRYAHSIVNLSILCPDPYFKATATMSQNAAVITSMFHLPCHFPCILGAESSTGSLTINNDGDTSADMVAELIAYATVTNPYIANDFNGKQITIKGTLNAGDKLIISTVRRQKTATINGVRCLINPSSQFSGFLPVGENHLRYSSDDGSSDIAASVQCTALYLGV